MFDQEDSDVGVALGVVFSIIALVITLVIGLGAYQLRSSGPRPSWLSQPKRFSWM